MQHWPWYLLIDESFIGLQGVRGDLTKRAHAIRARINQWVGIPCGVGIGQTKTLAKLANHIAKTAERKPGSYPAELAQVCNLAALPPQDLDDVLATTLLIRHGLLQSPDAVQLEPVEGLRHLSPSKVYE